MVEIMVVVILVGLMSVVAVSQFRATSGLSQLDVASNSVQLAFKTARQKAISSGVMHFVVLDTANRRFRINRDGSNRDMLSNSSDSALFLDSLGTAVRFGFGSNWSTLPSPAPGLTGFASSTVPRGGLGVGLPADSTSGSSECAQGGGHNAAGSWSDQVIDFCPGVVGDIETGVLYLSTTRSTARAYAVVFNDKGADGSLQVRRYQWSGGSWTLQ